jgi:glucosamine-6-phosphate deaminase
MIMKNYKTLSKIAAQIVSERVRMKTHLVLGLATGSTPLGMYRELVSLSRKGIVDFRGVTTFNLDEYYPISKEDPHSYYKYMLTNFWGPAGIPPVNVNMPDSEAADTIQACRDYEQKIARAGGMDLIVLGIGRNGHIGFNEPNDYLTADTHLTRLTEETIAANSRFFARPEDVPRMAITMGIGTIMKAREVLLLVAGSSKADIIKKTLTGGVRTEIPASLLQVHPQVTVLLEKAAARYLYPDKYAIPQNMEERDE